jgi:hypothetical protein
MGRGRRPAAELANAYLQHYRTRAESDFWAFEEMLDRITYEAADVDDAWGLLLALVASARDEELGYVGAGPIEDFVRRFGALRIEQLETQARRDPRFRAALGRIWLSHDDLPPPVLERVVRASDGQIRPLGSRPT